MVQQHEWISISIQRRDTKAFEFFIYYIRDEYAFTMSRASLLYFFLMFHSVPLALEHVVQPSFDMQSPYIQIVVCHVHFMFVNLGNTMNNLN